MRKANKLDIEKVLKKVKHYLTENDLDDISAAWDFCLKVHSGQKRKSGEDFAFHPLKVAYKLALWEMDKTTIIAGILHDVLEDTKTRESDIALRFGTEVANIVKGVTKVSDIKMAGNKHEQQIESLRRMILVMAKDLRVVFVRLADRLHNMSTLYALRKEKQLENSIETLEIYAPLADRLGMGQVKAELEDLSFPFAYPTDYRDLVTKSKKMYEMAVKNMAEIENNLKKGLAQEGFEAIINIRRKHLYSLWKKLKRPEIDNDLGKIFDLVAARIITQTKEDCYKALGVVHKIYRHNALIGVSDYIAQPKPNGYQSIHTKVHGPDGRIIEIQIRTKEMHDEAEHGLSAHWRYSHAKSHGANENMLNSGVFLGQKKYAWVQELVNWQGVLKNPGDFINAVKLDAFHERIFVFSPKGDAFDLPTGSTPVDFAYAVHTKLGNYIKLAKVNNKIVPLSYVLKSGDIVEIIKSKEPRLPNPDWLDFTHTTSARTEIKKLTKKV